MTEHLFGAPEEVSALLVEPDSELLVSVVGGKNVNSPVVNESLSMSPIIIGVVIGVDGVGSLKRLVSNQVRDEVRKSQILRVAGKNDVPLVNLVDESINLSDERSLELSLSNSL